MHHLRISALRCVAEMLRAYSESIMASNPSPIAAVSRDAADKLGLIHNSIINRCIVVYITDGGRVGYASYGKNASFSHDAKGIADALLNHVYKILAEREEATR